MVTVTLLWSFAVFLATVFAALIVGVTLKPRIKKWKLVGWWALVAIIGFGLTYLSYTINLSNDFVGILGLSAMLCVAVLPAYQEKISEKLFVALMASLISNVATFMFCGTTDAFLGARLGFFAPDPPYNGTPYNVPNIMLFMVTAKTLIKNHAQIGDYSPSKVLAHANEQLCEGNEAELFVTVWLAIIEISTGKGLAANAGHEHPALRHKDGQFEMVKYRHSPAVATMEGMRFKEHEFQLVPGDTLFVYTDGVPEATNANDELFGEDRLLGALNSNPGALPKELLKNVRSAVDTFVGEAPQFDDLTMLGFTYYGSEGK